MNNRTLPAVQVRLAFGWLMLATVLLMIFVSMLVKAGIQTDFSEFAHHPGPEGWSALCVQFVLYLAMATLVIHSDAAWVRWLNAVLLAVATLFMLAHQVGHVREGMAYGLTGVIDGAHHVLGALATLQAWRWARGSGGRVAARLTAHAAD
jgi:hypothetical protein